MLFGAIMTLPANDAFSLGLAHDHPRRSKISFSSPSPPRGMPHRRKPCPVDDPRRHARTSSTPNGSTPPNAVHKPRVINLELPRKALHSSIGACSSPSPSLADGRVSTGFFTVYLYTSNGNPQRVIIALTSALAVLIPIDILRLRYPLVEHAFEKCVGVFMRDSEKVCVCPDVAL